MNSEEIELYASHSQFYIQDSTPRGTPGDPTFWTEEASDNRLAIGDGLIGVGTGTYGFVKVRVEEHQTIPPLDILQWDHVTECGLEVASGFLTMMGCLSSSGLFFEVKPAHYRVRVCHANLSDSEREFPRVGRERFGDWYLVQFWPSHPEDAQVLKYRKAIRPLE
ncbi:MAG: hypothetical protein WD768_01270 [Phycisphaeraceae bacterium]